MSNEIVRDGSSWHYDSWGNRIPDVMDDWGNRVQNVDPEYDTLGNEIPTRDDWGNPIVGDEDLENWPA